MNDHLPNPWLSSPLCVFLDQLELSVIIAVPPDLYMECQGRYVSAIVTDTPFYCCYIILRNLSFTCLFFQCVLVSASNRMLNSCDLLLLQSSLREWAYVPKSKPLVFIKDLREMAF